MVSDAGDDLDNLAAHLDEMIGGHLAGMAEGKVSKRKLTVEEQAELRSTVLVK